MSNENERSALSSNGFSTDDQTKDVTDFLRNSTDPDLRALYAQLLVDYPEYDQLTWSGSWVDAEASGVDPDYMNWVRDWIENNTPVYWEDGEPWIGGNEEGAEEDRFDKILGLLEDLRMACSDAELHAPFDDRIDEIRQFIEEERDGS